MSLHVGHIPPRIRQEELERVFQRFGRCMLQMKDGYGFAVFEFAADAERALRALRGKNICGEPLSLNWSNRQPRPFPRAARSTKVHESYRRRNFFREEGDGLRIRGSQDRRDFSNVTPSIPAYNLGKHGDDVLDRAAVYVPEDTDDIAEERDVTLKDGVADIGNSSEPNLVEIERWGQPVNDEIAGNEMQNDREFDRYEPYHGYDREDEKDNHHRASSYGSPYHGSPQGKGRREQPSDEADKNIDNSKPQPTCYKCGLVGHIKRYCPEGAAKREKFSKFSHRRDEINFRGRNDAKLKMPRISSRGRPDASRDPLVSRYQERNRKESQFGKSRKLVRKNENFPERREKNRPKLREVSEAKKRSEQHCETLKKARKKRSSRRSDPSSLSSDSSTSNSRTHSGTSKSKSRAISHSTSRSISSRSRSVSSSSRSASVSLRFKCKISRSRSWSRSSSRRSPTLSVSLEKKSPSCPKNVNVDVSEDRAASKVHLEHPRSPSSKHHLHNNMESFQAKDGNGSVTRKINNEIEHSGDNADEAYYSASTSVCKEHNSGINLPKGVAAISDNCRERSRLQETSPVKLNKQIAAGSEGRNSTRITTQEMILALKHYGLPAPAEEGESDISVEGYFGAARLWPWEMIYYRRLKKGPISTGNYARRLEQNKEFGIEDRYIRSSSGWGEREQNDML